MSDNVSSFISRHGSFLKVGAVFLIGIFFIIFSGFFDSEKTPDVTESGELAAMCSAISGVGESEVMISYSPSGEVFAVAIICEGADSVSVRHTLTDMIGSLYGIGSNRISIVKSK